MYIIGGRFLNKYFNFSKKCYKYDIINLKWHSLPSLSIGRISPAVHKTKDARYLYVCLGGLKLDIINNVERLDLNNESASWEKIMI